MASCAKWWFIALFGSLLTIALIPAAAMDFSFRPVEIPCPGKPCTVNALVASGVIRHGDARALREFLGIRENALKYLGSPDGGGAGAFVILDSRGGDVEEAIRLAQVLREAQATVGSLPPMVCASACFFLYVGAARRLGWLGEAFAVHRPYFSADVTGKLSLAQAEAAHNAGFARAKRWLQDQLVSQVLIDKMFSLPSTDAYWLSEQEVRQLGELAPWYEEWLVAHCPGRITFERYEEIYRTRGKEEAFRMGKPGWICEGAAKADEVVEVLRRYERESLVGPPGTRPKGR